LPGFPPLGLTLLAAVTSTSAEENALSFGDAADDQKGFLRIWRSDPAVLREKRSSKDDDSGDDGLIFSKRLADTMRLGKRTPHTLSEDQMLRLGRRTLGETMRLGKRAMSADGGVMRLGRRAMADSMRLGKRMDGAVRLGRRAMADSMRLGKRMRASGGVLRLGRRSQNGNAAFRLKRMRADGAMRLGKRAMADSMRLGKRAMADSMRLGKRFEDYQEPFTPFHDDDYEEEEEEGEYF